jgi:hypothetical protein
MAPVPTPPPGNLTVPPLFGFGDVATAVVIVLVVAAAAFLLLATGRGASGRSEFEAWLDGRSNRPPDGPPGAAAVPAQDSDTPSR